jgi:hypothetical protein
MMVANRQIRHVPGCSLRNCRCDRVVRYAIAWHGRLLVAQPPTVRTSWTIQAAPATVQRGCQSASIPHSKPQDADAHTHTEWCERSHTNKPQCVFSITKSGDATNELFLVAAGVYNNSIDFANWAPPSKVIKLDLTGSSSSKEAYRRGSDGISHTERKGKRQILFFRYLFGQFFENREQTRNAKWTAWQRSGPFFFSDAAFDQSA